MTPYTESTIRTNLPPKYPDAYRERIEMGYIREMMAYYYKRYGVRSGYILIGKRVIRKHVVKLRLIILRRINTPFKRQRAPFHKLLADMPNANQFDWRIL